MDTLRLSFVAAGLQAISHLPAAQRADYHDLASDILSAGSAPEEATASRAAFAVANALRESEAAQMRLGLLLNFNPL